LVYFNSILRIVSANSTESFLYCLTHALGFQWKHQHSIKILFHTWKVKRWCDEFCFSFYSQANYRGSVSVISENNIWHWTFLIKRQYCVLLKFFRISVRFSPLPDFTIFWYDQIQSVKLSYTPLSRSIIFQVFIFPYITQ
jgi:hypothetical protein